MTAGYAELGIAVRDIAGAPTVIFTQPDIDVVDLRIGVNKLNRDRQAIDTRVAKSNTASRRDRDTIVVEIVTVESYRICRVCGGGSLSSRVPE